MISTKFYFLGGSVLLYADFWLVSNRFQVISTFGVLSSVLYGPAIYRLSYNNPFWAKRSSEWQGI